MTIVRLRRHDPRTVGSYRLLRRLGQGGMGVVYLGTDRHGTKVALKLIRQELANNPEFRSRFEREVTAAARVRGNRTAPLVDADPHAARPWMATAYVPGPSLHKRVGDRGPLGCAELARIGAAVADGLVSVHEAGVVHRDVKPSNILLSPDGPQIIDFGIAWAAGAGTLTHTGTAVGSPGFLAPEQVRGQSVTPATDVFALGVTLAYAARGSSPFGSGPVDALLYRVVHEEPDLDGVPEAVVPIIAACLSKDPRMRPRADEVRDRLTALGRRGRAAAADPHATQAEATQPVRAQAPHAPGPRAPERTPPPGRPRPPAARPGGRPAGSSRPPLRPEERRRLLLQRLLVFVIVTVVAALAITAFQGLKHHGGHAKSPSPSASPAAAPAPAPVGDTSVFGPARGAVPGVDWGNRTYADPSAGGAALTLAGGAASVGGDRVTLTDTVPAQFAGAPAELVVLTRTPGAGGNPLQLVQVFRFDGGNPVEVGGAAVPGDAGAAAVRWGVDAGVAVRTQSYPGVPDVVTRYAVGTDGTIRPA